ncbi:MAG: hypothetical protein V1662_01860 [Candidatus Omnitrophota bacterium]
MRRMKRRGQNTLEYVLLVTAVVGAFLAIQYYLNRGLQGRMRDAADNIGSQFDARVGSTNYTTERHSTVREINTQGATVSALVSPEVTTRRGSETIPVPVAGTMP